MCAACFGRGWECRWGSFKLAAVISSAQQSRAGSRRDLGRFFLLLSRPHHFTCSIDFVLMRDQGVSSRGSWRLLGCLSGGRQDSNRGLPPPLRTCRVSQGRLQKTQAQRKPINDVFQKKPNKSLSENKNCTTDQMHI